MTFTLFATLQSNTLGHILYPDSCPAEFGAKGNGQHPTWRASCSTLELCIILRESLLKHLQPREL